MTYPVLRPPWTAPRRAYSVALTEPVAEIFTVAEAKLRAGLDWPDGDPRDALMTSFIKAARQKVEQDTGLALLAHQRAVYVEIWNWTAEWPGLVPWPTQTTPLQQVLSVTNVDDETVLPPADYPANIAGQFVLPAGNWRVDIVAGWPTPAELAAAQPLLVQAAGLLTAHYATSGRDLVTNEAAVLVPQGYDDAIASYRPVWVP